MREGGEEELRPGSVFLDCLARPDSWNTTPLGVYLLNLRSNLVRSADLDGLDNARSIAGFQAIIWRGRETELPSDSMYRNITITPHIVSYRGCGRRGLNAPFITLQHPFLGGASIHYYKRIYAPMNRSQSQRRYIRICMTVQ